MMKDDWEETDPGLTDEEIDGRVSEKESISEKKQEEYREAVHTEYKALIRETENKDNSKTYDMQKNLALRKEYELWSGKRISIPLPKDPKKTN